VHHSTGPIESSALGKLPPLPNPTRVRIERSRTLSARVLARNGACYGNAVNALIRDVALRRQGARYVEGFVMTHSGLVTPVEHAWIELPDGSVVDPTPWYCRRTTPARTYFGAFRWTADQCIALLCQPGARYTFRLLLPSHGHGDPAWRAAAEAAWTASDIVYRHAHGRSLFEGGASLEQFVDAA
jgi:hypothetical protein